MKITFKFNINTLLYISNYNKVITFINNNCNIHSKNFNQVTNLYDKTYKNLLSRIVQPAGISAAKEFYRKIPR